MRALTLIFAAATAGCFTGSRAHLRDTSPRFAELRPQRIGVAVAGEAPRDAQSKIDRFSVRYPPPIGPDTRLPSDAGPARTISRRLTEGLVQHLAAKGYDAVAMDGAGQRVGDLLRSSRADAVLVVAYRSVHRWPVSEFQETEIRQLGTIQEEISHYLYTIERGLLLLPTAYLLDTRTSLRLWSHSNLGLQSDRVAMADPVRRLGVVVEGDPPPVDELTPRAVDAVLSFYFDSIPQAPGRPAPEPSAERRVQLLDEAATDRWRVHERLVLDVSGGYGRRGLSVEGPSSVDIAGDPAFGGYWAVDLGARVLGRRWIHGPRLAFQRSSADYRRLLVHTSGTPPANEFSRVALHSATALDVLYTVARAWQPRRPALLTAGLGPAIAVGLIDGDGLANQTLVQMGLAAEVEAMWAGRTFLAGPFARAAWLAGLKGASGTSLVVGARIAASY